MSDQNTPDPDPVEPEANQKPSRFTRIRERARGSSRGTVIGVVAGLLIGGAGGFAVAAVASGPDHDDRGGHHGRSFGDGDRAGHGDGHEDGERGGPRT